jgi:hypothetical protein
MPPEGGVLAVAEMAGNFGVLLQAIEAAGLAGPLAAEGPFTVLAPTDGGLRQAGGGDDRRTAEG